jgi:5-methyltetrahydropteroyltriglutamate--homocysteine methyltransferase
MQHPPTPHASFNGGNLDCGSGLLLLIRQHLDRLLPGQLLEVISTEVSVDEDLPAWCRLTGNELVSKVRTGQERRFIIRKLPGVARHTPSEMWVASAPTSTTAPRSDLGQSSRDIALPPLAVMGIGSWPRPVWLLRALHERLEGRLSETDFEQTADDAVRLAVQAQERAGVDVLTDGEQRRDSYASFVAMRLGGCQLVPIVDLLPYVEDPERFAEELRALDVPAQEIRQPVVRSRLRRIDSLAGKELAFAQALSHKPVKIALPGPYLLTRLLSLDCVSDRVYADRQELAADLVAILREELASLLECGAAMVQFDEPVLTEIVFGQAARSRSFMCGALAARRDPHAELAFAVSLLNQVVTGFPRERLAIHVCRGNWSRDEAVALRGSYEPLLETLASIEVGAYLLELCTPRAGEMEVLRDLPADRRIGVGVVNPKSERVEPVDEIVARIERAITLFGGDRVLLHPDCGFATFADSPVASATLAEAKLAAVVQAAARCRGLD